MSFQPNFFEIRLPGWVDHYLLEHHEPISSIQHRMAFVIEAARLNIFHKTGGPFAAAIYEIKSGKLVSLGVNLVTTGGLSMLHAEMLAMALAQKKTGSYDLGRHGLPAHELVTSIEPCAMCLGAIPWSGVRRVIIGAPGSVAEGIGFDEGPKKRNWKKELEKRGITVICGVEHEAAAQVLRDYVSRGGKIYNSRESDR
jgi:tRNA(Arg) A34 adenosine deaminase TadA